MILSLAFFFIFSYSIDETAPEEIDDDAEDEIGKKLMQPPILSDFLTARQSRNITMHGKKEKGIINGQYFRKPLVNLLQGTHPCVINLRQMYFTSFDGIILKGEGIGFSRFPDIVINDCSFVKHNQHPIHVHGPSANDAFEHDLMGPQNILD